MKVMKPEVAAVAGAERFLREIAIAAQLGHPNIMPVLDSGEAGGFLFYTMPFAEGETLRHRLDRERQLGIEDALRITREVAGALAHAHDRGVVHRDIKPENILLFGGQAVITDFGIARAVTSSGEKALTSTGIIVGTPAYMSPEQATGDSEIGPRSDLYTVGCLLYEMLAGHPPFVGPTPQAITARKLSDPVPPLSSVRETVSSGLERTITRALARAPADRFPTMQAFLAALERGDGGGDRSRWRPSARALRWAGTALGGVLVVGALFLVVRALGRPGPPRFGRIAVLPLANRASDSVPTHVLDGLTEGLIGELARLDRVEVIAPASVAEYRPGAKPHQAVGRELGVAAIVEGEVWRSPTGLSLALRLSVPDSASPVWSRTFQVPPGEVDRLEREASVALEGELGVSAPARTPPHRATPEVEDLYLQGRYQLNTRTPEGLAKALDDFRQALAADPAHAPSYAGLAQYYSVLPFYTNTTGAEAYGKARAAAQRAVELDPLLPDAHGVLGYVKAFGDWDWAGAEAEYARALALRPGDADLHHALSRLLAAQGKIADAVREAETAHRLDPLSLVAYANIGVIHYFGRNYPEAERRMRATLELDPDFPVAHWGLGLVYEQLGRWSDADAEFHKGTAGGGLSSNRLGSIGHLYGIAGRRVEAEAVLKELRQRTHGPIEDYQVALVLVGLDRQDDALAALERALQEHATLMSYLGMDPRFDPLRTSPRFIAMLRQMGLERPPG